MKIVIPLLCLMTLSGCAVTGAIVPAGASNSAFDDSFYSGETTDFNPKSITGEEFRLFKQGAHGGTSPLTIRGEIERSASDFCNGKGKDLRLLRQTASTPPYLLGNFPKVELVFECVESKHSTVIGESASAKVAPASPTATGTSDKYNDLARLKKLLDDKVITQQEFQREKDKILGKP